MLIENFDFDISNYNREELVEILKLNNEVNLNPTVVRVAASNMLSSLGSDKSLPDKDKIKVRNFLNQAVNKILFVEDDYKPLQNNDIIPHNALLGINKAKFENEYERPTIQYRTNVYKPENTNIKYANGMITDENVIRELVFGNKNYVEEVGSHVLVQGPKSISGYTETIRPDGTINVGVSYNPSSPINPYRQQTINKAINVDSRFRDNYYSTISTDYIINLPFKINKCISMQFSNLELPLTFYVFSHKLQNCTFNIIITYDDNSIVKYVCTIQEGNYGTIYDLGYGSGSARKALSAEINSAMQAAGIDVNNDLCFRVDTITGRSVFACPIDASGNSSSTVKTFEIQFAVDNDGNVNQNENIQLRLGWQLGFRVGTYIGGPSFTGATGAAVVSEGIYFPRSPRYFFLAINDYITGSQNDYFHGAFQSSMTPPNILTRIDIGPLRDLKGAFTLADSSGFVTQLNTTRNYFGPVTIEKLRVTLYDEYGRVVDLNNMDWSFSLAFNCLYD